AKGLRMVKRVLPEGLAPLGLSREEVAGFVGVSPNLFDAMVEAGEMPPPRVMRGRRVWSRREVEEAFHRLPRRGIASSPKIDPSKPPLQSWD
ncbi:MAG TPA: hypothetical protein VIF61_05750, partial [Methylocystis sp.]